MRIILQIILSAISAAVLILLLAVLSPLFGNNAYAVSLAWDAAVCEGNCTNGIDGYKIYWGNQSGVYTNSQDVGNVLQTDIAIPQNSYIAVTAYNIDSESGYSNEILYSGIPPPDLQPASGGKIVTQEIGEPTMGIAYVNSNVAQAKAVALTGVTAGNLIVCMLEWADGASTPTLSDGTNAPDGYSDVVNNNNYTMIRMAYWLSSPKSGTVTYTWTEGSGAGHSAHVFEVSGDGFELEHINAPATGSGLTATSGEETSSETSMIAFVGASIWTDCSLNSATIDGTAVGQNTYIQNSSNGNSGCLGMRVLNNPGTYSGTVVFNDSTYWSADLIGFVESAGSTLEQEGFRWRNDDGSETTATWIENQDVDAEIAIETNIRLRTNVNATGDPDSIAYKLQYKKTADSTYLDMLTAQPSGDTALYYFNSWSSNDFDANPNNTIDGNESTYGNDNDDGGYLRFDGNTCDGTDLGTITKVEIACYWSNNGAGVYQDHRPYFGGASAGDSHNDTTGARSAGLDTWHDITSDTNAPGTWAWSDVQNLESLLTVHRTSSQTQIRVLYIRVTYTPPPVDFLMSLSSNFANDAVTTAQLTAPATKTTGDFVAGRIVESSNPGTAVDITADNYTELEWCFQATEYASEVSYDFRIEGLDTYTVTPQLTIAAAGGESVEVDATTGQIAVSAKNATVSVSIPVSVSVTQSDIAIGAKNAAVSTGTGISAQSADIVISGKDASVSVGTGITATQQNISISGKNPAISAGLEILATKSDISLSAKNASIAVGTTIDCTKQDISIAAKNAELSVGTDIACTQKSISISASNPTVSTGNEISCTSGDIAVSAKDASVSVGTGVECTSGVIAVEAKPADIQTGLPINATSGNIAIGAKNATISAAVSMTCTRADISVSAKNADVAIGVGIGTTQGAIAVEAKDADIQTGIVITATTGNVSVDAKNATVLASIAVQCSQEDIAISAKNVTVSLATLIDATLASIGVEHKNADISVGIVIEATTGAIIIAGNDVSVSAGWPAVTPAKRTYIVSAENRVYTIPAAENRVYTIPADVREYLIT